MTRENGQNPALERLPSGIRGLDLVMGGGFFRGGVYIFQGAPGAGKTILGNQICFNGVRSGQKAVYVTLLAETHARLLQNLTSLDFYDAELIRDHVNYLSGFRTLEEEGLKGLVALLRREVRNAGASILVLDGLVSAGESAHSEREFKKFIHELQVHGSLANCTTFLLTSGPTEGVRPEHTMVDGILQLSDEVLSGRSERSLVIPKFRGGAYMRGRHTFEITDEGISLFPRVEAWLSHPSTTDPARRMQLTCGIPGLDQMLGGGLPSGSTTMLLGPSGVGKTSVGLHFLSASSAKEPGLFFGFFETPQRLELKSRALHLPFHNLVEKGHVEVIWAPPTERLIDELGHRLVEAIRRRKVKRVFIDGLTAIQELARFEPRLSHFFAAITNECRILDATTIYTYETKRLVGEEVESPMTGISALAENLLLMRFVEQHSELRRLVGVLKVRDSDIDRSLREFEITSRGIVVGEPFHRTEAVLSGFARSSLAEVKKKKSKPLAPRGRTRR